MFPPECKPLIGKMYNLPLTASEQQIEAAKQKAIKDGVSVNFSLFATFFCTTELVTLMKPFTSSPITQIDRSDLGLAVVITDVFVMFVFIFGMWFIYHLVRKENKRHKKLLYESKDFAVEIWSLPHVNASYSLDLLKANLWQHLENVI